MYTARLNVVLKIKLKLHLSRNFSLINAKILQNMGGGGRERLKRGEQNYPAETNQA